MSKEGKLFEKDFKQSFSSNPDISIDRLYDTMSGYKGHKNICDFIAYKYPTQFYFELKSYDGNSIPMSAIETHQYEGLYGKAFIRGVVAGVILQYRIGSVVVGTFFIDIKEINRLKAEDVKSITFDTAKNIGTLLEAEKIRTRYRYNVRKFLSALGE